MSRFAVERGQLGVGPPPGQDRGPRRRRAWPPPRGQSASGGSQNEFYGRFAGLPDQSALTPANFTTLADFSVSSARSLPKSAGEPGRAVAPNSANRAFILGSARAALISLLSLSTISAGVFFGAPTPVQKLDS